MRKTDKYQNIPGWEIVGRGLNDISRGEKKSKYALAVLIAAPRLNDLGFEVKEYFEEPNILLYYKLCKRYGNDAHYQYNAIMRRVTKFCNFFPLPCDSKTV